MKLTLLMENNSLYCKYYHAEHGFSAYIEDEGKKILYDTGYSAAFIKNAEDMGIDLTAIDYLVVSHGHLDHGGGVKHLIQYYQQKGVTRKPIALLTSPEAFYPKYDFNIEQDQGMGIELEPVQKYFDVRFVTKPFNLTSNLIYLGNVPRANSFECATPQAPKKLKDGVWIDDYVIEDTQLAYKHKNGNEVSVITGCSHNGICNIIEYAKNVTGVGNVNTVIGGLHLQNPSKELMDSTLGYIKQANIGVFYPCHDTDFKCKVALFGVSNIEQAGVGLSLDLV